MWDAVKKEGEAVAEDLVQQYSGAMTAEYTRRSGFLSTSKAGKATP
ncbi:MAG: hypothetical protein OXR68_07420 [Alphaproteobacteria bacterium]|nr:hypothetical protein [Alphaproteobacteria bacterium]